MENADWLEEVRRKQKRKNQILFSKDSPFLLELSTLLAGCSHKTTVLWALDLAEESVLQLKGKYPEELRPEIALNAARAWAAGSIKMRPAQRAILDCHAFAKEISCQEDIARIHAIGQACAVVHTAGHALGYPMYALSALVYALGTENCREAVEGRKQEYIDRLLYWESRAETHPGPWAQFLREKE